MYQVTVRKEGLLRYLQQNRSEHRAQFEQALEGYRRHCLELLENKIADLKAGRIPVLQFGSPVPVDHTEDYDRVIRMVEMELADEITLDEAHFAQYVMDDWAWKGQFITTNATYLGT